MNFFFFRLGVALNSIIHRMQKSCANMFAQHKSLMVKDKNLNLKSLFWRI